MNYAAKISEFSKRAAAIGGKLDGLTERRKEFALGAAEGTKTAVKAIQEIDVECDALRSERETLTAAIEQAERLKVTQETEIARKDRERRETEARKIADDVLKVNVDIDAAMVGLRVLLEKRSALIRQLGGTGTVASTLILRLLQNYGPTAAAHAAGLRGFIGLDYVPRQHIAPLVKNNSVLRSPGVVVTDDGDDETAAA